MEEVLEELRFLKLSIQSVSESMGQFRRDSPQYSSGLTVISEFEAELKAESVRFAQIKKAILVEAELYGGLPEEVKDVVRCTLPQIISFILAPRYGMNEKDYGQRLKDQRDKLRILNQDLRLLAEYELTSSRMLFTDVSIKAVQSGDFKYLCIHHEEKYKEMDEHIQSVLTKIQNEKGEDANENV